MNLDKCLFPFWALIATAISANAGVQTLTPACVLDFDNPSPDPNVCVVQGGEIYGYYGSNSSPWVGVQLIGSASVTYLISTGTGKYGDSDFPAALSGSVSSGSSGTWTDSVTLFERDAVTVFSNVPVGDTANVGFRVASGSDYYYGYINFTVTTDSSVTINTVSYENVLNTSISIAAVPEPATSAIGLGLMAFAGVCAARSKKDRR
jgi:hypothetical protein